MDSVPLTEEIKHNIDQLVHVTVKQEVIDNDYNHASRDLNSLSEDLSKETQVIHKDDADAVVSQKTCRSGNKLDFTSQMVTEDIKLETESFGKENQCEIQSVLKQGNDTPIRTEVLNDTVAASNKNNVKQEPTVTEPKDVLNRTCTINVIDSQRIDFKIENDEIYRDSEEGFKIENGELYRESEEGISNRTQKDEDMETDVEKSADDSELKESISARSDMCKTEGQDASNELDHVCENEHQSVCEKKGYKCKTCKKTFIKKSSLSSHEMTHTGETPFKCQVCNKGFNVRSNLNVHLRIHTGQRPHVCDICQKTFRQAGQLKGHERIHKGEKPYTCNVCSRSFRNSSALITHQRTHTGERPFRCDLCSRSFSTSTSLKTHRITHSGTMLYDCPVCGRQFNRKNNLNVHIKRHNKNRKFSCPKCSNGFVMRAHLLGHLKRAHKVEVSSEEINAFLDSCEETTEVSVIKYELESDIKNEENLDNMADDNCDEFEKDNLERKAVDNFDKELYCSGTKSDLPKEEIEVKIDFDDN